MERRVRLVGNREELQGRGHPGPLDKAAFERPTKIVPDPVLLYARWPVEGMVKVLSVGTDSYMALVFVANFTAERLGQTVHP